MTHDEVIELVLGFPGVVAHTASEESGAPEAAWGDTFFFYDPEGRGGDSRKFPFATIVISDYDGFDEASNLNRPGVFRLNIGVGRRGYEALFGHPPAAHAEHHAGYDYTALDEFIPHPVYAVQGWASILCPSAASAPQVREALAVAHEKAAKLYSRAGT
jgi:hypothetical protein